MPKAFKETPGRRKHRVGEEKLNQEFQTVWIEPVDEKYRHEGEWVTVKDTGNFWEGYLVDSPPGSIPINWMKGMYQIDPMKIYHPQPTPEPITVWMQSISNPRVPYKCIVRDYGTYWKGRRAGDSPDNQEESWPKIAYKIVHQAKVT